MSNTPKSYVNGRGETICTSCNSVMIGERYCNCNRHWQHGLLRVPLHREIPKVGDRLEIVVSKGQGADSGAELDIRVSEIKSVEWWRSDRGLHGVEFHFRYSIEAVVKNGKPKLQLIVGGGEANV